MILDIGFYIEKDTGNAYPRKLILGRAIRNAEIKTVGARGTSLLSIGVSPGKDEDILNVKMWGYDAEEYADLKKGTVLLLDAKEESREYNGKTYTDYVPLNVLCIGAVKPERKRRSQTIEPGNPLDGFTDVNHEDLPF